VRYSIRERIGVGGLGEVSRAFDHVLQREVALKRVKDVFADSPEHRELLEREARISAELEHPNIVSVHDRGRDADDRLFYVMRLIRGKRRFTDSIEDYHKAEWSRTSGARTLAFHRLLRQLIAVCNAIAYANGKAVIHYDLKPSNIMIDADAGAGDEPQVVDWGLAWRTDERAPIVAPRMGTVPYMSPEAAGSGSPLDKRTDVYSLGATLYHLLTGRAPIEGGDVHGGLERIRRGDFPQPRQFKPDVPMSLEAICLKAMALNPEDRYSDCNALAADLERWLADEPVSAWREPFSRQVGRWMRRHRTAAVAAFVALAAGMVGLVVVAGVQARANRDLWKANFATEKALTETKEAKTATDAALAQSEDSRDQAEAVSSFLVAAFRSPDPYRDGRQVKVVEILDRASERLDKEYTGSQATRGAMMDALGQTYRGLGLYDQAVSLHTRARDVREATLGPDHPDLLASRDNLAVAYRWAGRLREAIALHEETLKLRETKQGPDHPGTIGCRNNLANAYWSAGRLREAIALHEETLRLREAKRGPDHPDTLASRNNLALAYVASGRLREAIELFKETLRLRESKLGLDHLDTIDSRNNLADAYYRAGRVSEAIVLHEETLKAREARLGPDHPLTLTSRNNLAAAFYDVGRASEAIELFKETLRLRESKLGLDHPLTLRSGGNLAIAYQGAGRTSEAIVLHQSTLKLMEVKLGSDHPDTLTSRNNLATAYRDAGRLSEAIVLHQSTLKLMEVKLGPHHPLTLASDTNLATAYRDAGRLSEAIALHQSTLKAQETKLGPDHPDTLASRNNLAIAYEELGGWMEAENLERGVLARRRKTVKPDSPLLADDLSRLARNLVEQSRLSEAEPLLRECLAIREKATSNDWAMYDAMSVLGGALMGQRQYARAEPLVVTGYEGMKAREDGITVPERYRLLQAAARLVRMYEEWGKTDQATAWKAKLEMPDLPADVFQQ
jgi:tetratricopeptide (TPR) repeat protein